MKHNGNLQVAGRLSAPKLIVGDFVGTTLTSGSYEFPLGIGINGDVLTISGGKLIFDHALTSQVAQISGYINENTNSINTLFSTYANSTTVESISAGLQTQIDSINIEAGTNIIVVEGPDNTWNISVLTGVNGAMWFPVAGNGMSITPATTSSNLFTVIDYISKTTVAAISAGLQSQVVQISGYTSQNTNGLNTLFSTYANSTTVAAISAGLQSQILASSGAYATIDDIINLDLDLQSQITNSHNSIKTLYSTYTNISTTQAISAGLQSQISQIIPTTGGQGTFQLNTSNILFTITHSVLTSLNSKFPIITLQIPSSGSNLLTTAITNRTLSTFDVILSQVPNVSGYYVNWLLVG
jgi:hypothetical protein